MYNKMYGFPLVVAKDGVPAEFRTDDSRTELVSSITDRQAKRKRDLEDGKLFQENEAKNKKIMAMCEDVFAQSNEDNVLPKNTVFELMQKIDQSHDFAKKIEIDISNLREKKKSL